MIVPPADSLRAVLDSVFAAPAYQWTEPPHPFAFLSRWWNALADWLAGLRETAPQLFELLFWGLVVILVLIFVHAGWVMVRTVRSAGAAADRGELNTGPERHDAAWYRRRASSLADEGRYVEAMPLDFLALVLELDQRQVLRYHPSKTPIEYTLEARLPEPASGELRELVRALYGYVFARRPCGPEEYRSWRARTDGQHYAAAH